MGTEVKPPVPGPIAVNGPPMTDIKTKIGPKIPNKLRPVLPPMGSKKMPLPPKKKRPQPRMVPKKPLRDAAIAKLKMTREKS